MNEWFWHFLIACYFIGGLGIGYLANEYRHKEKEQAKNMNGITKIDIYKKREDCYIIEI